MSIRTRLAESPSIADLRVLAETIAVIVATWVLLGWLFDRAITQSDGSVFGVPYTQSALRAGFDWTHHLYRFGVLGGASMHDYAGTLPIVQVCGLLGLSTTATVNAITMFVQACFGFFGIKAIAALIATWSGAPVTLSPPQRIIAIWACGFAPVIGWRLAVGHEALLLGLLPMVATLSLLWAARAGTVSNAALVIATIAVVHGVSGLGEQTLIYSAMFGAPLAIATVSDPPRGSRWGRPQWSVVLAIAAGALIALPRVVGMIHFAASGDAGRSLTDSVTYSYGAGSWRDWLASIPWTRAFAAGSDAHERNFAIGPLIAFIAIAWPRGVSRRLVWGVVASAALAIVFADDIAPLSTALLELPTLGAFRVPARAILPVLMLVPTLALACAWAAAARGPARGSARVPWLGIAIGALVIAIVRGLSPVIREPLAWIACIGLAATIRWRPISPATLDAVLCVTLALGVIAFDERFPRDVAVDTVEHGPKQLHDAVLAQAPELAMALHRVEIVDPPLPFAMSMAFAAQLSSLDGDFNPPRRFLQLLSALSGQPVPPTTVVFRLARGREFPVLQQMYDVDYLIGNGSIEALPATLGPAWFPEHVVVIDDAADMTRALGRDVHTALATTAWLLRRDPMRAPVTCEGARVTNVTTDELGQTATIAVEVAADCALIVATNYVGSLHATATVGGATREVAVFPIDVALTGIAVPAGATTIELAPRAYLPWWSRVGSIIGVALLLAALARRTTDR